MLTETQLRQLQKADYKIFGRYKHSAVKLCLWCKKSIKTGGKEFCYKQKWYGINSHRCIQMTPILTMCNLRCTHCWRDHSYFKGQESFDSPEDVVEGSIKAQKELLTGLGGVEHSEKFLKEANNPNQVAISLDGEPTLYPHLSRLIELYHEKGFSTFLVTNGMRPDVIEKLTLPTNFYISLSSNSEEMFLRTQHPVKVFWKDLMRSLDLMKDLKTKRVLRLTLMDGINMNNPEKYAELIEKASPDFVEVKAYMSIGASINRVPFETMPSHEKVKEFAEKISEHCRYNYKDEQKISRVVLLS